MIQGGGFTEDFQQKRHITSYKKIRADNGLKNKLGTIAMARTSKSAFSNCSIFINVNDNFFMTLKQNDRGLYGYCVLIDGLNIVLEMQNYDWNKWSI